MKRNKNGRNATRVTFDELQPDKDIEPTPLGTYIISLAKEHNIPIGEAMVQIAVKFGYGQPVRRGNVK